MSAAAKQWHKEKKAAIAARAARSKGARPIGHSADSITWLPHPIPLGDSGSVRVIGVAADASAETKAQYGV